MSEFGQFPTTTPRSSHVGQPGYDSKEDWMHFLDKYKARTLQFGRDHYPRHQDLVEDVFQTVLAQILTNPFILAIKPDSETHFRSILLQLYNRAFALAIRQKKAKSFELYRDDMEVLAEDTTTFECDRHRRQLLAVAMIRNNFLRSDYPNGRFSREIKSLDLSIWRALQKPDATLEKVALKLRRNIKFVSTARDRVEKRIIEDATALLDSLGLL